MRKLPKQFQRVLWSYDINKLDKEEDKKEIIVQTLNYGTWEDLKLLFKIYPEKDIKEVVKTPRRGIWFEKVLNFWLTIFNIRLKDKIREKAIFKI